MESSVLYYIQLSKSEIDELKENSFKFEQLKRSLSNVKDFQVIDSYHHFENKLTHMLNKLLAAKVCANYNIEGVDILFEKTANGKPYVTNYPKLKFNMSNCISQYMTTMVINNEGQELGIDIANINDHIKDSEVFDYTLYEDILSINEKVLLSNEKNLINKIRLFTMIWAVKESYTKLIGLGLTHSNLSDISVFEKEETVNFEKSLYKDIEVDSEKIDFKLYWLNNNTNVICICQKSKSSDILKFPSNAITISLAKLMSNESVSLLTSPKFYRKKHKRYISLHMSYLPHTATSYAPNRLTIIFYTLLSMYILGVENKEAFKHVEFVKSLYIETDEYTGFSPDKALFPKGISGISQTFFGILNLLILDQKSFEFMNIDRLCNNLLKDIKTCNDVRELYMSCSILFIFDKLDLLGLDYIVNILNSKCFVEQLGFINYGKGELHSGYISCVASIYKLLKIKYGYEIDADKKILIFEWLCHRQISNHSDKKYLGNGGFNGRENKNVDICYSFWNLSAMSYFQLTEKMPYDLHEFENYAFQMQDTMKGGFGKLLACHNDDNEINSDLFHTFTALCSLGIIDGLLDTTLCLPYEIFNNLLLRNGYL
ncbi:hypothetical protein QEN19_000693 [Hanseniaspora menglaensis]